MFGFPAEAFPLIATLGFLFDPAATCLNAAGDTIASMMVTRLVEGKRFQRSLRKIFHLQARPLLRSG